MAFDINGSSDQESCSCSIKLDMRFTLGISESRWND